MEKPRDVLVLFSPLLYLLYPALVRFARSRNWRLTVCERHDPPPGWRGDGAVLMLLDAPVMRRFASRLRRRRVPFVDLLNAVPSVPAPRVLSDYAAAARLAAGHFRSCGFEHTAFFAMERTRMHDELYGHFLNATRGNPPLRWLWPEKSAQPGNRSALSSWTRQILLSAPKPVGVWCFNDYNAAYLADVCRECGLRIPQEVAILGHGDVTMHTLTAHVPLSSVAIDWNRRVRTACSLLERLMNGGAPCARPILIRPLGIVVRQSTDGIAIRDQTLRTALTVATDSRALPCGVDQIARKMKTSRAALNALSKRELGGSLHSAIVRERLRKAERLLAATDLKLSAIAAELGFCHASYFIRLFKSTHGLTPAEWRLRHSRTRTGESGKRRRQVM